MTPIGSLILGTALLTACVWLPLSALRRMKSRRGLMSVSTRGIRLLASPYEAWLNAYETQPMAKGRASVQCIKRKGMDDLYIAGHAGVSVAFYNLEELSDWLMDRGVPFEDPVWDQIDQFIGDAS